MTAERWEGKVTALDGATVTAEVVNLDTDEHAIAEFDRSQILDADLGLLTLGALFFWEVDDEGSYIEFRRVTGCADRWVAPWTDEQVFALHRRQGDMFRQPYTCPDEHGLLLAGRDGWKCFASSCDYRQNWAHPEPLLSDPGGTDRAGHHHQPPPVAAHTQTRTSDRRQHLHIRDRRPRPVSDPTALFAYGVNLGDGSGYFLTRRDVFDEIDGLYKEHDGRTPPELRDGLADFLRDRLAGFAEPEPDFGDVFSDPDPNGWDAWNGQRTAAHATLRVELVQHGGDSDTSDTHLILAAKPTYRADWNGPISVPQVGTLSPLFEAVSGAMETLGIETSERPGWLLAAYGG